MPALIFMERLVRRLESHSHLSAADRDAVRALPYTLRTLDPGQYLVREGDRPAYCSVIAAGFAYCHKVTGEGARQIVSVHMTGEFIDLQNVFLSVSDHNVQALTRLEVAFIPRAAVRASFDAFPGLAQAMWTETLIDASIFREWTLNIGRRDSISRIAHLLCELALRMEAAGLANDGGYGLPMTQEQLADAVGLTPVHVNRVLKELGKRGLITRDRRAISIPDWENLREVGDFNARYLHLDQATPDAGGLPRPGGAAGMEPKRAFG
jgi:CRP-like cAMP-binding protein